jgi:D-xylose 1-dehydrogenase (NADP+, D-xylono-1,5-lactone-forming)
MNIRWGIMGTGNIAGQFCGGVRTSQRNVLQAVGSRAAASAQTFAANHKINTAVGSYAELVADPAVDAIYISLPNSMHHEWTIKALRAGKHVLCEKPMATNASQTEEMFDVAKQSGRVLVEAFMYRSNPLTLAVKDALAKGVIGQLRLIRTCFCFRTARIAGNIRFDSDLAGGALMDVGCYCINFTRYIAGAEPTVVHVAGKLHSSGVDEFAAGMMHFPNDIVANFACGMTLQADNITFLCGTEGYIEVPIPWKPPVDNATYVVCQSVPPRQDKPGGGPVPPPGSGPRDVRKVPVHGTLYALEADDFAAAVLDGKPPRLTRQDSVGNMRVLDEMRRQLGVRF